MIFKKLFSVTIMAFTLWLAKFLIVDYFAFGWAGYGKFNYYAAAALYAISFLFYLIGGLIECL
jgi:hypothetical protein